MGAKTDHDRIHQSVSKTYTNVLTKPQGGGCCGAAAKAPVNERKAAKACAIGYEATDFGDLPADVVENSFGCGNPLAFSGVKEGDTVVDLGSGAGIDLLIAGRKTGSTGHVIGVDMTDAMIERARQNIANAGMDHVEVRKGHIEALPIDDASVDWVISNCVINLSPDKPSVFREIARVLRPGGQMLVSDIVVERLPFVIRKSMAFYGACVSGAIPEHAYLEGLRQAGLADVAVRHRVVYDRDQLVALTKEELVNGKFLNGLTGYAVKKSIGIGARWMENQVQSVQVYARKPACCS